MTIQTRGSATLDKAQRRLALLKGIDTNLDVGNGRTIEIDSRLIDKTRNHLETHNTLLSEIDESRQVMTQLEVALAEISEHMLRGVGIKYGKKSIEYSKAGGTTRKRSSQSTASPIRASATDPPIAPWLPTRN